MTFRKTKSLKYCTLWFDFKLLSIDGLYFWLWGRVSSGNNYRWRGGRCMTQITRWWSRRFCTTITRWWDRRCDSCSTRWLGVLFKAISARWRSQDCTGYLLISNGSSTWIAIYMFCDFYILKWIGRAFFINCEWKI